MGKEPLSQTKDTTAKAPAKSKKATGIRKTDRLEVAARKVFKVHYSRLLKFEKGTRSGEDIEPLHQFRVSSRRLRAALRLFGPYLPPKLAGRLLDDLRHLTRSCGPPRDLDVHIDNATKFGETLPEEVRPTLQPLLDQFRRQGKAARQRLVEYLDSDQYQQLKEDFQSLVGSKSTARSNAKKKPRLDRAPDPSLLGHIVPSVIWKNYQTVRAYEAVMKKPAVEQLHALRIDCKRLRYAMEMVQEVLGEAGIEAITIVKNAQEHLGELHDAHIAAQLLWKFIKRRSRQTERTGRPTADITAVQHYFVACEAEEKRRMDTFPILWAELNSTKFRQLLAEATANP